MVDVTQFFLTLGALFLVGLLTDLLGRKTFLPRVSLLMLFGFVIGPAMLDIIPELGHRWFPAVADMALVMIGFLLGGKLTLSFLKESGRQVLWISIFDVLVTATVVTIGLWLMGQPLLVALLIGSLATATDPAATVDVIHETKSQGLFSDILTGIVSIDDIWGVVFFTVVLSLAMTFSGTQGFESFFLKGVWDIGGAVLLGALMGIPMAYLTGRIRPGEPTLVEALGFVFLCAGLAFWLDVSFLIAPMVMGIVVVNLAKHHSRPFHVIKEIGWPFLILFFILSGASLHIQTLMNAGFFVFGYIVLRVLGRFLGAGLGAKLSQAETNVRRHIWLALMPQAGVALGMALYATQRFQELGEFIMPIIIGGTIVFELVGPLMTKLALKMAGESA